MNVVSLEFPKCCECGSRATKKLELIDIDGGGPVAPKHFCDAHFPEPLGEDGLRLLLDKRDAEITELRDSIGELVLIHDIGGANDEILAAWERARELCSPR